MDPFLPIRIISRKIGKNRNIVKYIDALKNELVKCEGFIKMEKYYNISTQRDYSFIITTDWETKIARDRWYFGSSERSQIYKKYKNDIELENFEFLVKKKDNNDIFLL